MPTPSEDVVVFRRWKDSGDVIAPFPEIPADVLGRYCEAYEHVGQHGGADFHGVIQATTAVEPEDADDLTEELIRIGYNMRPIKRASWRHHERRREEATLAISQMFDARMLTSTLK